MYKFRATGEILGSEISIREFTDNKTGTTSTTVWRDMDLLAGDGVVQCSEYMGGVEAKNASPYPKGTKVQITLKGYERIKRGASITVETEKLSK